MSKTILVVEDDREIQDLYEKTFSDMDVKILKAYDGEEGLKFIDLNEPIDVILLDLIMPNMNGLEFLKIIRKERKLSIPVIICTVDNITAEKLYKTDYIQGFYYKLDKLECLEKMVKTIIIYSIKPYEKK